jgi:hypothetical protein
MVESVDRLKIERTGGPGFGGPHLKSRGELALSELSSADRQAVDALFSGVTRVPRRMPDEFVYSVTRETTAGAQTIQVPESVVPTAIKNRVRDVLE